jgi:hypothetical protein
MRLQLCLVLSRLHRLILSASVGAVSGACRDTSTRSVGCHTQHLATPTSGRLATQLRAVPLAVQGSLHLLAVACNSSPASTPALDAEKAPAEAARLAAACPCPPPVAAAARCTCDSQPWHACSVCKQQGGNGNKPPDARAATTLHAEQCVSNHTPPHLFCLCQAWRRGSACWLCNLGDANCSERQGEHLKHELGRGSCASKIRACQQASIATELRVGSRRGTTAH